MRPHNAQRDYILGLIFLMGLLMAWPWIAWEGLPNSLGSELELARLMEVNYSLQNGVFYPRWAAHFHFGYGSPVFNYLAPLPHYLGGIHLMLSQGDAGTSLRWVMAGGIILAGLGMFVFVRSQWGSYAGLCASVLYLLAPPVIYRPAYVDVQLSLILAAALFPWVLWATDSVGRRGDGPWVFLWGILGAALLLSHNLMGPLLWSYALVYALVRAKAREAGQMRPLMAGLLLSLGLSAFYTLPLVLESRQVQWRALESHHLPLSLRQTWLMIPGHKADFFGPSYQGELGWLWWVCGLFGAVFHGWERARGIKNKPSALPFILGALLFAALATQTPSTWLDESAQFPHLSRYDLLLPLAASLAILGGLCAAAIETHVRRVPLGQLMTASLLAIIILQAHMSLQAAPFSRNRELNSLPAYLQRELQGVFVGGFSKGVLLPRGLQTLPPPSNSLVTSYLQEQVIKIERASSLPGANLGIISHGPTHDIFRVDYAVPVNVEVLTLAYQGWRARFGDDPLRVRSDPQSGLIMLSLPQGRGTVELGLGQSRAAWLGLALSGLSLFSFPLVLRLFPSGPSTFHPSEDSSKRALLLAALALGLFFLARQVPATSPAPLIRAYPAIWEGGVDLVGYQLSPGPARSGQTWRAQFYWQASRPNLPNYAFRLELLNLGTGEVVWNQTRRQAGGWVSSDWPQAQTIREDWAWRWPAELGAGSYQLRLVVLRCQFNPRPYLCQADENLRVFDPRGDPLGDGLFIGEPIHLEGPP
jgi:hypothetical protein